MDQTTPPPIKTPEGPGLPKARSRFRRLVLRGCCAILALMMVLGLVLFRIYGVDTHHSGRGSIWWPERGRNLIPPTATQITLRRDLLDHFATYTISEADLNVFLNDRFADNARNGKALDSFSERKSVNPKRIGNPIDPLGWVATEDTVVYHYTARNGGLHSYYHDSNTGQTYQSSAYW